MQERFALNNIKFSEFSSLGIALLIRQSELEARLGRTNLRQSFDYRLGRKGLDRLHWFSKNNEINLGTFKFFPLFLRCFEAKSYS